MISWHSKYTIQVGKSRNRWLNQNNSFKVIFLSEGNMNVLSYSINTLKGLYDISGIEIG